LKVPYETNISVQVCIADVQKEEGLKTLGELSSEFGKDQVEFVSCDVSDPQQIQGQC